MKRSAGRRRDRIPGGLAAGRSPADFDRYALAKGTSVELEHTSDPRVAQEIAMDHLTEDPRYYEKLARMEAQANPRPLFAQIVALRDKLAAAAQDVIDAWEQDEDEGDPELGFGGACDVVANALSTVLSENLEGDVAVELGAPDGEDHQWVIVADGKSAVLVDIPANVYETGGGYSWRKVPDAEITTEDVVVEQLPESIAREWLTRPRENPAGRKLTPAEKRALFPGVRSDAEVFVGPEWEAALARRGNPTPPRTRYFTLQKRGQSGVDYGPFDSFAEAALWGFWVWGDPQMTTSANAPFIVWEYGSGDWAYRLRGEDEESSVLRAPARLGRDLARSAMVARFIEGGVTYSKMKAAIKTAVKRMPDSGASAESLAAVFSHVIRPLHVLYPQRYPGFEENPDGAASAQHEPHAWAPRRKR